MRHRMAGRKLGRNTPHRKAMWRNMAVSLFTHGQITTTLPKAKSVRPLVERIITAAKKGDIVARRRITAMLGRDRIMVRSEEDESLERNKYGELKSGPKIVKTIVDDIAPRFQDREGGYTRIIRLDKHRIGDASQLCVLQLLGEEEEGPQISGRYSRRRDKANKRMTFAAGLRKGDAAEEAPAEAAAEEVAEAAVEATEEAAETKAEDEKKDEA
ncbi:50S ribosomal protein L17 [Mucisphaera calidilacus]|uniref:Large ribosomal subunit protein bL17 n=1 Tax=Mucisphaera calidilacus TaxID=2527982 RepID=A0A518BXQ4_9BACT|nr:50S ribosomal protein L17 [Mucisphaera calidilacus]QDU71750.1 50S ribosomal protein L17 [Mucisphaera calidilacus]